MTKVYKIEPMIVDHDGLGPRGVTEAIEDARYANHRIAPKVTSIVDREVDWEDDNPLNRSGWREAFRLLFSD